ncbi:MAG: 3-oxoadipate--succinyl-CoA transferase subunit A [Actinobacteria bacterium 69-20]|jgi:glutaconate CoA-transferase subunit A|nr:CoA transferase subunit A [Actinomycetota bacterium]OJV26339.1 MAG: 3-oxoadipate--succinyl-CoA transferase subunit A [Actinobacteria bacterium 69-20]
MIGGPARAGRAVDSRRPRDKVSTLPDAIARYVRPGSRVALEGFGHLVPMAAAHEIIRQRIADLTICRMSCDMMIDQLLAAGCLRGLITSFLGNSSGGSLHELRRALEGRSTVKVELQEFSHGGMIARYIAGAAGLPFYPIRSYDDGDLRQVNPLIASVTDPFSGDEICVVPALRPDVSVVHAQRADRAGNVQAWGILGVQQEVAFAGKAVIVTVEEIVDDAVIRADPNRTIIPAQIVSAVVPCPGGAYPCSVQGFYDRDDAFFRRWSENARDEQAVPKWLRDNVYELPDHAAYLQRIGAALDRLRVVPAPSGSVDYGSRQPVSAAGPGLVVS